MIICFKIVLKFLRSYLCTSIEEIIKNFTRIKKSMETWRD